MENKYDVVIVGAGPAGLTAAIYASRANLSTLMIEAGTSGGKLYKTHKIDNFPGVVHSSGAELADKLVEHSQAFGASILNDEVVNIEHASSFHRIRLASGNIVETKAVIIATGTKERLLKLPGALEHIGNGVSYCAVCDGFFYRGKNIVVIGAGNAGMEESLFLSDIVKNIIIIEMADEPLAEATICDAVAQKENIRVICHHTADSLVIEDDKIIGINIKDTHSGEIETLLCGGIFPYMGADPCTNFVEEEIKDERGYIVVNADMSTSIPGIYGAGDCVTKNLRQVITACNDGAIAAKSVASYLKK